MVSVGPGQPVGPRIHPGREDDDLLGRPRGPQQGLVEEPGADDDLRRGPLTGCGDGRGQQLSAGVPGQLVGERVGEQPVVAGGFHGADGRDQ